MSNSYLFYDIETSGLNKCFDQVLQFAAMRTDLDLHELERHEILVRLNPDIIPSPSAVLTHQLTLDQMRQGRCEYEALQEIHRLFNTPGTITVGYNNLGFDDEFLRFSFYRNLLPPYTHQYANNCSRMDIYPMTVMYYLFKPHVLGWPKINNIITFKLEHLSAHNGVMNGNAHEAMSDVAATLALAKLLKKEQKMWEYLCGCFNKPIDLERLQKLSSSNVSGLLSSPHASGGDLWNKMLDPRQKHSGMTSEFTLLSSPHASGGDLWNKILDPQQQCSGKTSVGECLKALLVDGSCGGAKFYQCPVIGLGMHNHYSNQSLWLPLDAFSLTDVISDNISTTTFVKRKRFGEPPILLPLTAHFSKYLDEPRLKLVAANISWLHEHRQLFLEIASYHKEYKYPEVPNLDVDAALYQVGFLKDCQQLQCNNFHVANLPEKIALVDRFSTPNLRLQAIRILGRNYPEELAKYQDLSAEFKSYLEKIKLNAISINYKNEMRLTPKMALAEIENLQQTRTLNVLQSTLLMELSRYIQHW